MPAPPAPAEHEPPENHPETSGETWEPSGAPAFACAEFVRNASLEQTELLADQHPQFRRVIDEGRRRVWAAYRVQPVRVCGRPSNIQKEIKWPEAEQGLAPAGLDVKRAKLPKKGTLPHRYRAPARPRARESSSAPAGARELVVVWRGIEALIPYARNARTHSDAQIAQIAGSIREFGFTNPVLIDARGRSLMTSGVRKRGSPLVAKGQGPTLRSMS